jgi:hypothetical protein
MHEALQANILPLQSLHLEAPDMAAMREVLGK